MDIIVKWRQLSEPNDQVFVQNKPQESIICHWSGYFIPCNKDHIS